MPETLREWLSKRYTTLCPHCEREIHVTRSMGMYAFGMEEGYGTCPYCKNMSKLKYDAASQSLSATRDHVSDSINEQRVAAKQMEVH